MSQFLSTGKIVLKANYQRVAVKDKRAYVTRAITYSRIASDALLARAAANSGIRRGVIYAAMDAVMNEFQNFVLNGHTVELPLIGAFGFGIRAKISDTREDAGAAKVYQKKLVYRPSVELKQMVKEVALAGDDSTSAQP